jgi:hypothetical protein
VVEVAITCSRKQSSPTFYGRTNKLFFDPKRILMCMQERAWTFRCFTYGVKLLVFPYTVAFSCCNLSGSRMHSIGRCPLSLLTVSCRHCPSDIRCKQLANTVIPCCRSTQETQAKASKNSSGNASKTTCLRAVATAIRGQISGHHNRRVNGLSLPAAILDRYLGSAIYLGRHLQRGTREQGQGSSTVAIVTFYRPARGDLLESA